VQVQPQAQKKVARAQRIEGAIILYRPAARNQSKPETWQRRAEPWGSMFLVGVPLFLWTLVRLVFVCRHQHKSSPMRVREPIPSNLHGRGSVDSRGTYIICLDCGQKFAYDYKTRRLVDFWGVRDAEAAARVRRRAAGFFSPFRGLAAWTGRMNMRASHQLDRSMRNLGNLIKSRWSKSRHLIASKWVPRSHLKRTH
jgi:hypothetical protein